MLDSPDALSAWLKSTAAEFEARIDELDGLDAAIGDGDHGTNMARGMATAATITPGPDTTTRQYLNQVGMALVSSVGGASGPLYGTFFLRVGQLWQSPHTVSSIWQALKAGRDGIASRGRAKVGDKTMLDACAPPSTCSNTRPWNATRNPPPAWPGPPPPRRREPRPPVTCWPAAAVRRTTGNAPSDTSTRGRCPWR